MRDSKIIFKGVSSLTTGQVLGNSFDCSSSSSLKELNVGIAAVEELKKARNTR